MVDEVGSDVVGIRLSPFTEFYGAIDSGKIQQSPTQRCAMSMRILVLSNLWCLKFESSSYRMGIDANVALPEAACAHIAVLCYFTASFLLCSKRLWIVCTTITNNVAKAQLECDISKSGLWLCSMPFFFPENHLHKPC